MIIIHRTYTHAHLCTNTAMHNQVHISLGAFFSSLHTHTQIQQQASTQTQQEAHKHITQTYPLHTSFGSFEGAGVFASKAPQIIQRTQTHHAAFMWYHNACYISYHITYLLWVLWGRRCLRENSARNLRVGLRLFQLWIGLFRRSITLQQHQKYKLL